MFRPILAVAGVATVLLTSACGSGGGSKSVVPAPTSASTATPSTGSGTLSPNSILPVTFSVYVPSSATSGTQSASRSTASGSRSPQYLPLSVGSITFAQTLSGGSVVSGPPTVLAIGGASCSPSAGGQTCTATLQGALGQDAWTVNTYTTGNGTGSSLSTNSAALTVVQGAANVVNCTLNPILASLAFAPVSGSANATAPATLALAVLPKDASGATIVGPGSFVTAANAANPITLASSTTHVALQTSGGSGATTTLNQASDDNLGQIVYDGSLLSGTQTVTATAGGISATYTLTLNASGSLTATSPIAMGADLGTSSAVTTIAEPGFSGNFALSSADCAGVVTFPASVAGPTNPATVNQVGGGTCHILVSDGLGNSTTVVVKSTTIAVVLN